MYYAGQCRWFIATVSRVGNYEFVQRQRNSCEQTSVLMSTTDCEVRKMKMQVTMGHPILIFIYSSALLLFGCAVGILWAKVPSVAVKIAILGAVLMVIHDALMALLSLWIAWYWIRTRNKQNTTR
jgi:hypothetical protein